MICKPCKQCGEIFNARNDDRHYCSRSCYYLSKIITVTVLCDFCGKIITRKPSDISDKNYCSLRHAGADKRGDKSTHWKGGVSGDRYTAEYKQWRLDVMKRDEFTCSCCNGRGGTLEVHHILAYSRYPEARLSLDNGATLCKSCHKDFHTAYGKLEFTDSNYFKWITRSDI